MTSVETSDKPRQNAITRASIAMLPMRGSTDCGTSGSVTSIATWASSTPSAAPTSDNTTASVSN